MKNLEEKEKFRKTNNHEEQIVGIPARGGRAPVVEPISHGLQCVRLLSSASHPLLQCDKHQRQWWSFLHLRQW